MERQFQNTALLTLGVTTAHLEVGSRRLGMCRTQTRADSWRWPLGVTIPPPSSRAIPRPMANAGRMKGLWNVHAHKVVRGAATLRLTEESTVGFISPESGSQEELLLPGPSPGYVLPLNEDCGLEILRNWLLESVVWKGP